MSVLATRRHPGLQHRSRRGRGRRRSRHPAHGEPRHRPAASGGVDRGDPAAIGTHEANSWLPFTGRDDLKEAVASFIERRGGPRYDGRREIVITSGEGTAMLDALFCLTDPGDEVILTDPTYAGMINRVRLVGAVPRLVPLVVHERRVAPGPRRAPRSR